MRIRSCNVAAFAAAWVLAAASGISYGAAPRLWTGPPAAA